MAPLTCADCGATDGVRSYGLCTPCTEASTAAERAAQGLPAEITDPATRLRAAEILGFVDPTRHHDAA